MQVLGFGTFALVKSDRVRVFTGRLRVDSTPEAGSIFSQDTVGEIRRRASRSVLQLDL